MKIARPLLTVRTLRSHLAPMNLVTAIVMVCLLCAGTAAQTGPGPAKPGARAEITGMVIKDPANEPVKKALIELIAESQGEGGDYTAISAADGSFHIEGIVPGRYRLFTERTGLLEMDKHRASNEGRLLTLTAGQELRDIQIHLQAAAVVHGRVTDEDGDPLPNAQVAVMRQTFASGHGRWEQAGGERTNDLGEYRIANLPAGSYCVSVSPPPDTRSILEAAGAAAEGRTLPDKPTTSYQTTYYPGTTDRSQAAPVQLRAGDEFPVNFSLTPSPSLSIRGSVVNLPPRSTAAIVLQSRDFNFVLNGAEMHKDGSFIIRDVVPGGYTIVAMVENAPVAMTARQSLQVVSSIDGLRLSPQPGAEVRGRLRLETKGSVGSLDPSQIFLALRAADGDDDSLGLVDYGFSNLVHVAPDGSFEWKSVPPGSYYVQLAGDNTTNVGWFLKSVQSGGRDTDASGISVNGGVLMLDIVASANGATVEGVAVDSTGSTIANAVIVAVPELRLRSRLDRYSKTATDQTGHFTLRGVAPGDYTLYAWDSVDGEAYYNPDFLKNYEGQGSGLRVSEGEKKTVQVKAITDQRQ